jgi:RimJ/RimL family protein N-acetyltransferase
MILEPLAPQHRELLRNAAAEDQSVWTFFPANYSGAGEDFDDWFDYSIERFEKNEEYPFAVRRQADNKVMGTTRFCEMVPDHLRLTIGSTWYVREARGTLVNPEVRLLQLSYAFDKLLVNRVELRTDPFNLNSRAAMKILGAVQEGVIRNHMIYKNGRIRDSVLYGIIKSQWPNIRDRLMKKLGYTDGMIMIG